MMKRKLIGIFLILMLSVPVVYSQGTDSIEPYTELPAIEEVANTEQQNQLDEDTAANDTVAAETSQIPHKQPMGKKKLVKLFLKAMIAVGISCIILYLGLSLYNRFRGITAEKTVKTPEGETTLEAPDSIERAVKTFLEKTKWG